MHTCTHHGDRCKQDKNSVTPPCGVFFIQFQIRFVHEAPVPPEANEDNARAEAQREREKKKKKKKKI